MAKEKTVYVCSNCGQESPKWVGKCPSCGEWNTYVEEIIRKEPANRRPVSGIETAKAKPVTLSEIEADDEPRIDMHDEELNRVLGGGLVPGSLVLIGGEPGIGKSTLVLQTVLRLRNFSGTDLCSYQKYPSRFSHHRFHTNHFYGKHRIVSR